MPQILITAEVEDSITWEKGFRTHRDLFRDYTATAIHFTTTDSNEVGILWEVNDLKKFLALVDSPATADAMEFDGVRRESVKIFVLDKTIDL